MMKTVSEARKLLDNMASNYAKWQSESRSLPKKAGVFEVDQATYLQAQISALTKQIADLKTPKIEGCEICSGNHKAENCTATLESVQYVRNQGNFASNNNYGNQWRGQPSNSWNPQPQAGYQRPMQPPGFQHQPQSTQYQQPSQPQNNFQPNQS